MSYETLKSKISTLISKCANEITQRGRLAEILTTKGVAADKSEKLESLVDKTETIESGEDWKRKLRYLANGIERGMFDCEPLDDVDIIAPYAFYNCSGLTWDRLGWNTIGIGLYAFYGCSNLAISTVPKGVTHLEQYCFSKCTSIKNFSSETVERLDENVFQGCTSLEEVYLPNTKRLNIYIFDGCTSLRKITIGSITHNSVSNTFRTIPNLEELIIGENFTSSLYLQTCTNLTLESAVNIALNFANMTGLTAPKLLYSDETKEAMGEELRAELGTILAGKNIEHNL